MTDIYTAEQDREGAWFWVQRDAAAQALARSSATYPTEQEAEQAALRAGDGLSDQLAQLVDQMVNQARIQASLGLDAQATTTLVWARTLNTLAVGVGEGDRIP